MTRRPSVVLASLRASAATLLFYFAAALVAGVSAYTFRLRWPRAPDQRPRINLSASSR